MVVEDYEFEDFDAVLDLVSCPEVDEEPFDIFIFEEELAIMAPKKHMGVGFIL